MKIIKLTDGQEAKCDDEDYPYLNQFVWHAFKVGKMTYAGRIEQTPKGDRVIWMHDEVMERVRRSKLN